MEDSLGRQCIHLAAFAGNMASVMYLVENYQMDINVKTSANQSTPLHFAAKVSIPDLIRLQLEYGFTKILYLGIRTKHLDKTPDDEF